MAARDQVKAAAAREILAAHPDASLEIVELDLGSLASVEAAADAIAAGHDRIDILMCNAGVMAMPAGNTEDGFDTQMGVNVLGHWALIARLLPIVVATPGARVVTVSSTASMWARRSIPPIRTCGTTSTPGACTARPSWRCAIWQSDSSASSKRRVSTPAVCLPNRV